MFSQARRENIYPRRKYIFPATGRWKFGVLVDTETWRHLAMWQQSHHCFAYNWLGDYAKPGWVVVTLHEVNFTPVDDFDEPTTVDTQWLGLLCISRWMVTRETSSAIRNDELREAVPGFGTTWNQVKLTKSNPRGHFRLTRKTQLNAASMTVAARTRNAAQQTEFPHIFKKHFPYFCNTFSILNEKINIINVVIFPKFY